MKTILLMILLGILLSCRTSPPNGREFFQDEQCSPEFKIITDDTGKEWVDVASSVCRCRPYHIGKDYVGPVRVGGSVPVTRKPLKECNLIKGYTPKKDTELVNFLDWVRTEIELSGSEDDNEKDK